MRKIGIRHPRRRSNMPLLGWGAVIAVAAALLLALGTENSYADPLRNPHLGVASGCDYECRVCGADQRQHDIVVSVHNNASSSHLENCNAGGCDLHSCKGFELVLDDVLPAVYVADGRGLKKLLRRYPNTLSWNEERQSLQVTWSEGFTIANIPLTPSQAQHLTE